MRASPALALPARPSQPTVRRGRQPLQPVRATAEATTSGGAKEPARDAGPQYSEAFVRTRLVTFAAMFLAYGSTYLTRLSLTYAAPVMLTDPSLGLDMKAIGGLTSILPLAYGFSKFASGVLGARTSPTVLLAGGLMATALINIAFGFSSAYLWFCIFWGANGLLQGIGAPACSRILTSWFAAKERGTFWGFWTASNNVGGFIAPLLAGAAAKKYGWRWGMFAPGAVGLVVGVLVLLLMRDDPKSAGFPPVEQPKKAVASGAADPGKPSMMEALVNEVLRNPFVVMFALTYFFVYVVRQGVTSWFIFYLIKAKGIADTAQAALQVSGLELGGLAGSLSAGAISDFLVRTSGATKGAVGLRVQVAMAYTVGTAVMLAAFWFCPPIAWLQWLAVAAVGFCLYGPQMLVGLLGAETVSPAAVSACQGFLGWVAYLGAASAGVPLAYIVQRWGWNAYFATLIASCGVILLLLTPAVNLKSYVQRASAPKAA